MSQEIVKILRVETQGSERTVKSLKDEISALKDALLNSEKGTKTYDDIVKQLKSDYNDLSTVMNAGKKDVEALEGSYNYLVKTMGELKKEWRATTDEVRRNQLGQEIDNINTQLKEMDASIGNYQRNVGNYTESFSDAMKQQQEATEVTRAKFEAISKVATGLASGYAAVQGAMALMGVENEKLEKTFVKLQAAIALAQGIGGLKDLVEGLGTAKVAFKGAVTGVRTFITSLRGVKAAIAGTGIGLLVVAVGMLIEHYMTLEDETEDVIDVSKKLRLEQEALASVTDKILTDKQREAYAQYVVDVRNAKDNVELLVKAEEKLKQSLLDIERAKLIVNAEDKQKAVDDFKLGEDETIEEGQARLEKLKLEAAQAYKELQKFYADRRKEEADAIITKAEDDEANKNKEKEIKTVLDKIAEANRTAQEQELYELEQTYNKEKELLKGRNDDLLALDEFYNKKRKEINDKYKDADDAKKLESLVDNYNDSMANIETNQTYSEQETEVKYDGMETDNPVQAIQNEIDKLSELKQIRLEAHNERLAQIDTLLSSELIAGQMRIDLENEKNNLIRENAIEEQSFILANSKLQKQKINEEKKLKQQQVTATINTTKSMLSAVSSLMKEGSKEQKGVASAIATMDALQAANGAYAAMASIPVVGPALGAAAAAAALIAGYANVKAIWAVDDSGSNTSALTGNASVTPTFNAEQAMPVQYTRELLTDNETDKLNQTTKVVVLESDITETQNKVKVSESNATF